MPVSTRFFATSSFALKASSGVGTILAGLCLDPIHWPRGKAIRSAADVPPETLTKLAVVYGPLVGGIGLLSVWLYKHYTLTREGHAATLLELKRRRAAEASQAATNSVPEHARLGVDAAE